MHWLYYILAGAAVIVAFNVVLVLILIWGHRTSPRDPGAPGE